jgi:hypothetical protein
LTKWHLSTWASGFKLSLTLLYGVSCTVTVTVVNPVSGAVALGTLLAAVTLPVVAAGAR